MTRMHLRTVIFDASRRTAVGTMLISSMVIGGCTTNYLTNSTEGTYGVPITERTIPQRLLDRSIEHTVKVNIYGLKEDLQQTSRIGIDSFNSDVLLSGEVPTEAIKAEIEKVVSSMPDVRRVYNELVVSASKGYSSTVQDGYITSKILAKIAANNSIKTSQIKTVSNNGVVYIMGRVTPTQQSHLVDIANSTVGVTELVLLTTLVDDRGIKISRDDIMYEDNTTPQAAVAVTDNSETDNRALASDTVTTASPVVITEEPPAAEQSSTSPYIDLYQDQ